MWNTVREKIWTLTVEVGHCSYTNMYVLDGIVVGLFIKYKPDMPHI